MLLQWKQIQIYNGVRVKKTFIYLIDEKHYSFLLYLYRQKSYQFYAKTFNFLLPFVYLFSTTYGIDPTRFTVKSISSPVKSFIKKSKKNRSQSRLIICFGTISLWLNSWTVRTGLFRGIALLVVVPCFFDLISSCGKMC